MLRRVTDEDEAELQDLWLLNSLQSLEFVQASCWWKTQQQNYRDGLVGEERWVLEENGVLIAALILHRINELSAELISICVRPERQRQGIGSMLLESVLQRYSRLSLRIYAEDPESLRFYMERGFTLRGEETDPLTHHTLLRLDYERNPTKGSL